MSTDEKNNAEHHRVVSTAEWFAARSAFLVKEKEFTRLREELARQRRELPWESISKAYTFEGPDGKESLAKLFAGRSQLIVYHFMFAPEWNAGCPHCSFWADNFNNVIVHLNQRDVTMIAVSRAPYQKLEEYRNRMGWTFKWVSSNGTDFNFDYHVSFTQEELKEEKVSYNFKMQNEKSPEREGISVFFRDAEDRVFHTYSTYARGIDLMNTTYNYLDLVPKGRDENGRAQFWVRRHDEYDAGIPLDKIYKSLQEDHKR